MQTNPFDTTQQYVVDMEDYKLPYRLISKTDDEVMKRKYQGLTKSTHKYVVRLGIGYLIR